MGVWRCSASGVSNGLRNTYSAVWKPSVTMGPAGGPADRAAAPRRVLPSEPTSYGAIPTFAGPSWGILLCPRPTVGNIPPYGTDDEVRRHGIGPGSPADPRADRGEPFEPADGLARDRAKRGLSAPVRSPRHAPCPGRARPRSLGRASGLQTRRAQARTDPPWGGASGAARYQPAFRSEGLQRGAGD